MTPAESKKELARIRHEVSLAAVALLPDYNFLLSEIDRRAELCMRDERLEALKAALKEIMREIGTSTRAWHLAKKALIEVEE